MAATEAGEGRQVALALDQLAATDAVLRSRQAEIRAARRLIRGWAGEIQDWLSADAGTP
jgi:hypothetical protein